MSDVRNRPDPQRWKALVFIALAQLMVVLDATIVNIALPSAQRALHISDADRQWVITAYTLAFGGLLLFGGRIADLVGRKRMFVIGLLGFAGASALGGAAVDAGMLLGARALQGAFGAMLAPAALSLLSVMFTEPGERARAFGVYGAIAGGGAAVGLILGGLLTEHLNWRWTLYVNVVFAVVAVTGAFLVVREPAGTRARHGLDVPGVLLATAGLVSLVQGFTRAESAGWTSGSTLGLFAAAVVLLGVFVVVESRVRHPLLPMRVLADRNRAGVHLAVGLAVIGMFGLFLFLTYYLQLIKGYTPVRTGLAFLPMVGGMVTGSTQIGTRLMTRVPPRLLMGPGLLLGGAGMLVLTRVSVTSSYTGVILPGMVMLGFGMGTAFMPAMSLATYRVAARDAGVASAMVNTAQQVGGSIGTALLNTLATSATAAFAAAHRTADPALARSLAAQGAVHGYAVAIRWAVGILVLSALLAFALITTGPQGGGPAAGPGDPEDDEQPALPVIAH